MITIQTPTDLCASEFERVVEIDAHEAVHEIKVLGRDIYKCVMVDIQAVNPVDPDPGVDLFEIFWITNEGQISSGDSNDNYHTFKELIDAR